MPGEGHNAENVVVAGSNRTFKSSNLDRYNDPGRHRIVIVAAG